MITLALGISVYLMGKVGLIWNRASLVFFLAVILDAGVLAFTAYCFGNKS